MYLWLGSLALVRAGSVEEHDPSWQAQAGMEWLDGAALQRPDSWSWTPVGGDLVVGPATLARSGDVVGWVRAT